MSKKKVLFAAFEATPFIKTGGLGDVAGSLPAHVKNEDFDARVILPLLSSIPQKYKDKMKFVENYKVWLGWRSQYCGLFTLRQGGVTYYFLDNEYYFSRSQVYGEFDDGERVAFFSMAVLETIRHIARNFKTDFRLVATGGFAKWVLKDSGMPFVIDPTLTLHGAGLLAVKELKG